MVVNMRINDPMSARAFIAECMAKGYQVRGLHNLMTDEEWVRVAISTWKRINEEACGDKIIKFPVRKKTLFSIPI